MFARFSNKAAKPTVYIETSVVSYAAARASRNIIAAAHQKITRDWWEERREMFVLYSSQLVIDEAAAGDAVQAKKRELLLSETTLLDINKEAERLAEKLMSARFLPAKASNDALHLAVAAVHGMDFLLTWNCTHLNNAAMSERIRRVCEDAGYSVPVLCTPEELNLL
jgi:predicted nucleic acid-binding protein